MFLHILEACLYKCVQFLGLPIWLCAEITLCSRLFPHLVSGFLFAPYHATHSQKDPVTYCQMSWAWSQDGLNLIIQRPDHVM